MFSDVATRLEQAQHLFQSKQFSKCSQVLAELIQHDPTNNQLRVNYAKSLLLDKQFNESLIQINKAIELNPTDHELLLDKQLALSHLGHFEQAYQCGVTLLQKQPKNVRALYNMGWHLMRRGQLYEGLRHLDYGRLIKCFGSSNYANMSCKPFSGDIIGKKILLAGEGGLGDQIINIRYASVLKMKGASMVIASCDRPLMQLFKQIDGVDLVVDNHAVPSIGCDFFIPAMSAAGVLETLPKTPYIKQTPMYNKWDKFVGSSNKIKIGIRWQGNPEFEHDQMRTFDPNMLQPLFNHPKVEIYSFQRDDGIEQLPKHKNVCDLSMKLNSWQDTQAALSNMDIVVTSCTSIAHLSAALGIDTRIIVPKLPYYTWSVELDGNKSMWYDSVTLYRQQNPGDFSHPCNQVVNDIFEQLKGE